MAGGAGHEGGEVRASSGDGVAGDVLRAVRRRVTTVADVGVVIADVLGWAGHLRASAVHMGVAAIGGAIADILGSEGHLHAGAAHAGAAIQCVPGDGGEPRASP